MELRCIKAKNAVRNILCDILLKGSDIIFEVARLVLVLCFEVMFELGESCDDHISLQALPILET